MLIKPDVFPGYMRTGHEALHVPDYLHAVLDQVEQTTGYSVQLREQPALHHDSETRFFREGMTSHEVRHRPAYSDYALHFLLNGAWKILRFWQMPPEERLVPVTEVGRQLPDDLHRELADKLADRPQELVTQISRFLYQGIVTQLISMPGDIRVEQELAREFPKHRGEQDTYLRRQIKDLEAHFTPEISQFAPARLYAASSAMHLVLTQEASAIVGVEPPGYVRASPHLPLACALRRHLSAVEESGYRGDRIVTERWAEELGMERWFEWVKLWPS